VYASRTLDRPATAISSGPARAPARASTASA